LNLAGSHGTNVVIFKDSVNTDGRTDSPKKPPRIWPRFRADREASQSVTR
jgi:hypothetical protein